jgi:hypothetical protein
MDKDGLSELRLAYKRAVKAWIETIRAEESLATTEHSMTATERWGDVHFRNDPQVCGTTRPAQSLGLRRSKASFTSFSLRHRAITSSVVSRAEFGSRRFNLARFSE